MATKPEDHKPIMTLHECTDAEEQDSSWPDGFVEEILTLLDRIDVEEDSTLAIQRHAIAEKYGMTVVLGEPISGMMN